MYTAGKFKAILTYRNLIKTYHSNKFDKNELFKTTNSIMYMQCIHFN